jgi:hypothetical protein
MEGIDCGVSGRDRAAVRPEKDGGLLVEPARFKI